MGKPQTKYFRLESFAMLLVQALEKVPSIHCFMTRKPTHKVPDKLSYTHHKPFRRA